MQKTNFKTRLLALLTAVFMVVMCVPFAAFAKGTDSELKTIHVQFKADNGNDDVAGGYALAATSSVNNIPDDVFSTACPEGKVLDHWTCSGKDFAKGTEVTFEQLAAIVGTNYTTDGEAWVTFYPVFKDEKVEPQLKKIIVAFKDASGKEMAAGYTLTATSPVNSIAGDVYATACPEGKELDYWTFSGKTFAKGADVTFDELAEIIGDNVTADGESYVTFAPEFKDKAVEPAPVKLKKIIVAFKDASGKEMAAGYTLTATSPVNSIAGDVYATACPAGKELDYWTFSGKTFAKGADVTFDELAAIIGDNVTADGESYVTFVPEFKDKTVEPAPVKLKKIIVSFNDASGKEMAAGYTLTATSPVNSIYDSVYATACPEGKELDYWTFSGKKFAKGSEVTFAQLAEIIGDNVTANGESYVNFVPEFKDKGAASEAIAKNVIFQVSQVEGAKWATKDDQNAYGQNSRTYTVWSDTTEKVTAPAAAKDGKDFDYWVCTYGDKKITLKAGEEFNFDTLTNKGISETESGDFAFNPVFKDKAASSSSNKTSSSASSNKTTAASSAAEQKVVKAAAAPANTTKVLPKTGASNVAPLLGGSLAVVALLMGYGVYSLVLRKKD